MEFAFGGRAAFFRGGIFRIPGKDFAGSDLVHTTEISAQSALQYREPRCYPELLVYTYPEVE